jgi:hypothetical protein
VERHVYPRPLYNWTFPTWRYATITQSLWIIMENTQGICCCWNRPSLWLRSYVVVCFCVQWVKVRGDCWLCWYYPHCLIFLFIRNIDMKKRSILGLDLRLWFLTPLSTIFQLYRGGQLYCRWKTDTRRKPRKSLTNLITLCCIQ